MGGAAGPKERKATGIYEDRSGITIRVRGKDTKPRWPLGTPLATLMKARKALLDDAGPLVPRHGTLADDVVTYLATLPDDITTGIERRRRKSDAARLLQHWIDAATTHDGRRVTFGQLPRDAITSLMVKTQLAAWRSAKVSEGTCDHRRRELGTLYNVLNGKEGYNPVRAVAKFNPVYDDPRGFDPQTMRLIIDSMPDRGKPPKGSTLKAGTIPTINTAKLRLRVLLECGIPPQTLKKVTPADFNRRAKTLLTKPRRKGEGAKGRLLPLTRAAVEALDQFADAQLFGWFDQSAVNCSFKRAAARFRRDWLDGHPQGEPCPVPNDLHAYDLRHVFASEVFRRTGNKKAVAHLLGQTDNSPMADRYVQAAVDDVARAAIEMVEEAVSKTSKRSRIASPVRSLRRATG